jgi:hypothetical protein
LALDSLGFPQIPLDFSEFRSNSAFNIFGFPWIFSSETGLFNGLRALKRKKKSRASLPAKPGWPSDPSMTFAVTLEAHADRLSKILLFSNELAPICRKTRI